MKLKQKMHQRKKKSPKYHKIDLDKGSLINFRNEDNNVTGFGWNNSDIKLGISMEGYFSTILFEAKGKNCKTDSLIKLNIEKYYKNLSFPVELTLILNRNQKEDIILDNNKELVFKFNCKLNDINTIDINVKKPKSLFDLKKGLNRVKKSIVLNSITIGN